MNIRRLSFGAFSIAVCLAALGPAGLAQTPAPQTAPPTFRSAVDLLTIDTSVRDKGGLTVPDLQASDFSVTIDGRPRKVVSAVFFNADPAAGGRLSGGAQPTPQHVSNDGAKSGRVLVFALDAGSITQGKEKSLFDTAARMLDALSPADAVGLMELPAGSPYIEVTRDRRVIAEALKRFRGRAPREAEQLARGGNLPKPSTQATSMQESADSARSDHVLLDLAALVRRMSRVRAPRSVILISGGLGFDPKLVGQYAELQRAAAESRVTLYTVLVEQQAYETGFRGETRPDAAVDPALSDGLATIASRTGGMFFTGIGRAAGVFDRLTSEVTSFYQLGLESSPADADGKEHDIKVRVSRPGVDVRAQTHVAVAKPAKAAPRDPLALALEQPTDVPDVPLAVTTYTTRPSAGAVQLLISAEIGASNGAAPAEWGVAVNQNGKNVVTRRGRIPAGSERPRVISTAVELLPGDYHLRVAAVDAEDRIGVLEIPVTARYQTAGATVLSDLIVGIASGGQLEPRRRIAQSEQMTAMLEVTPESGVSLGGTLQLVPGGSARSVLNTPLTVRPASSPGAPATLEASATLAAVPPGRYTASAVIAVGGQLTQISRVIEIIEPRPGTTQPDALPPPIPTPAPANASAGSPDEIMRRVGAYVEQYGGQASLLVSVEHYIQAVTRAAIVGSGRRLGMSQASTQERRLVSEFVLVPNASASGGWLGYRDVIEMDGKPIADRHDRLQALFQSGAPDLAAARQIADESARYNIGPVSRNFNVPTTTLFFFHAGNLNRFSFHRKGRERIESVETVEIEFAEERTPTLIMNSAGKDVPTSGTLWVDPRDGAVVRTRLGFRGFDTSGTRALIEVSYQLDKALGMWVPSRMTERYSGGTEETATTLAVYRDFKRFQTSVKIK